MTNLTSHKAATSPAFHPQQTVCSQLSAAENKFHKRLTRRGLLAVPPPPPPVRRHRRTAPLQRSSGLLGSTREGQIYIKLL